MFVRQGKEGSEKSQSPSPHICPVCFSASSQKLSDAQGGAGSLDGTNGASDHGLSRGLAERICAFLPIPLFQHRNEPLSDLCGNCQHSVQEKIVLCCSFFILFIAYLIKLMTHSCARPEKISPLSQLSLWWVLRKWNNFRQMYTGDAAKMWEKGCLD